MLEIEESRIVAVEVEDSTATLFYRLDNETVELQQSFTPWLLATEKRDIGAKRWKELKGEGHKWLATFDSLEKFGKAKDALKKAGLSVIGYTDPIKQYCMQSGNSMFGGMAYKDLRRMELDIECTTLDPEDPDSRLLMVAIAGNGNNALVLDGSESEILRKLNDIVEAWNPDVIEGHNLLQFDMPYLDKVSKRTGVELLLGRDGSVMRIGQDRECPIGPIKVAYRKCYIYGRHVVDTLIGVRRFDMAKGELASYGLKEVAKHYKMASEDRVYIDQGKVVDAYNENQERVKQYARNDVEETGRLSALVMPTEFFQTQFLPDSYQNVCTTGNGEKVNSLLVREYLRRGVAIPISQPTKEYPGGYTDIRMTGLIHNVVKCDVESLYPSIMLNYKVKPKTDTENVFLGMLETLTKKRLEAKARMKDIDKRIQELKNG